MNLGAFGGTVQASQSPPQYVLVTRPDGGEVWPQDQAFPIAGGVTILPADVTIELAVGNSQSSSLALTIADSTPNDGDYLWTVPETLTAASDYFIRVTRRDAGELADDSDAAVHDRGAHAHLLCERRHGELGRLDHRSGDDANDGLSPATPKSSVRAVLQAYDLGATDTIRVDTGTYNLTTNLIVSPDDSGVKIEGYHDAARPERQAIINRGSTNTGSYVVEIAGADDVTLDHLSLTGGQYGVVLADSIDSDRVNIVQLRDFRQRELRHLDRPEERAGDDHCRQSHPRQCRRHFHPIFRRSNDQRQRRLWQQLRRRKRHRSFQLQHDRNDHHSE